MNESGEDAQPAVAGELHRSLRFHDLLIYGMIFMVPIAPFGIFGSILHAANGMIVLAYALGMVAMLFTASSYAEMSRAFPVGGSVYAYVGRGIGAAAGFLSGWMILLDYVLVPALLYVVSALAANALVPAIPPWGWSISLAALNTIVNCVGIELTARVNRWILLAELLVLGAFLATAAVTLGRGGGNGTSLVAPLYDGPSFSWNAIFGAVSIAALSFLGFDGISTLAEESRDARRAVGRATMAALLICGGLFVLQSWAAALLLPQAGRVIQTGDPNGDAFYSAARAAGGAGLAMVTGIATIVAWGFANALAAQAATSRLLFAMARDGRLPRTLAKVGVGGVPIHAVVATAAVSVAVSLLTLTRSDGVTLLGSLVNFGALTAFMALHVSVMVHFAYRQHSRSWARHLLLPMLGFAIIAGVMINANVLAQMLGFAWFLSGGVVLAGLFLTGRLTPTSGLFSISDEDPRVSA